MELWQDKGHPDIAKSLASTDGACTTAVGDTVDQSYFWMTIIVDNLDRKTDEYCTGLIAHELAHMSHELRTVWRHRPALMGLKPKAKVAIKRNLLKGGEEREQAANDEACRIGFGREIEAMKASKI